MAAADLKFGIEAPREWGGLGRAVEVRGWCFDASGGELKGVRARVGDAVFKARRKQTRFGVAQMFPGVEGAVKSGFTIDLQLPRGRSEIIFECRTADGAWHRFAETPAHVPWFRWGKKAAPDPYQTWLASKKTAAAEKFAWEPQISILLPTYNTPEKLLRECLDSVIAQTYENWELCIADDASPAPHVRKILDYYTSDPRIRVTYREENGHISQASNTALEMTGGEFVALLDHDDTLPPDALHHIVAALQEHREAVVLYSDEDKIDESGERQDPYFKSDYDPDLLLGQNCISHLGVYRTTAVREVGGFRHECVGSQDWDLAFRILENCQPGQVVHVPEILYHWRLTAGSTSAAKDEKPYAEVAGLRSVQDHLDRTGQDATASVVDGGLIHICRKLPEPAPSVEIIIPTRDHLDVLKPCLESLKNTGYPNYIVTIVDNGSEEPATLEYLSSNSANVIRDDGEFNYSRLNNSAAKQSQADVLLFLNNDTEIIHPEWLTEMVSHAVRPEIGAVGAKLLYSDGSVQHAGVFLGFGGAAGHLFKGMPASYPGQGQWMNLTRRVSAVTAACLAVSREKFLEVGGMDEGAFAVAYNDVDLCLKLSASGYAALYTPFARLYHHESKSRGKAEQSASQKSRANEEIAELQKRWGELLRRDPYYNSNLTLEEEDGGFAAPRNNL